MERREKSFYFGRRCRETLAMVLCMLLIAGLVIVPLQAAENASYSTDELVPYQFYMPGDSVESSDYYSMLNISFPSVPDGVPTYNINIDAASSQGSKSETARETYYINADYVLPAGSYQPKTVSGVTLSPVYQYMSSSEGAYDNSAIYYFEQYNGFKVVMHSDGTISETEDYCYYYGSGEMYTRTCMVPEAGEIIGWSTSQNYVDKDSSGYFLRPGDEVTIENAAGYLNGAVLDLYPLANRIKADEPDITMSGYTLTADGAVPSGVAPTVSKASGDERTYTFAYVSSEDGEPVAGATESGDLPTLIGTYMVHAHADATDSEFDADGMILSRGLQETDAYSDEFTVKAIVEGEVYPADNLVYDGTALELAVIPSDSSNLTILFSDSKNGTYSSEIPKGTNADSYSFWYKLEPETGDPYHVGADPVNLTTVIDPKEVEIGWPAKTTIPYDGTDHFPKAEAMGVVGTDDCQVAVKLVKDGKPVEKAVEPGEYTAVAYELSNSNYTISDSSAEMKFTIVKGTPTLTKNPGAVSGLQYSGTLQEIVSPGEAENGTILYSMTEDGTYSEDIPKAKNVGSYTVWYRVDGDENYEDLSPESVVVSIDRKTVGLRWENLSFAYDGKMHCPTATATGIADGETCTVTVTGAESRIGTFTATATALSNSNYVLPMTNTTSFTIGRNLPTIKVAPAAKSLTENGSFQELVSAGAVENGTILYSMSKDGTYSTAIPVGKDAGEYTVWYKVNGNSIDGVKSYGDIDPIPVQVTIAKKQEGGKEEPKPAPQPQPSGKAGNVSLSVGNAIYGGPLPTPSVSSTTNTVSGVTVLYKPSNAPDSSYGSTMPTEVGTYTAKVTLPATGEYGECSTTCEFSISYLPVPDGSYSFSGKMGANGWYTSEVCIVPGAGYQVAVGRRAHFSDRPVILNEANGGDTFFIRRTATGEQTAGIQIATLKIDTVAPLIRGIEPGGICFADESGAIKISAADRNLRKVLVDGTEVKTESDGSGGVIFELPYGKRKQKVKVSVMDDAGNEADMEVTTAPAWMKDGIIVEGDLFLESDTQYKTPAGSRTWTADGDPTTYMGGISFYSGEGDYTFHKH